MFNKLGSPILTFRDFQCVVTFIIICNIECESSSVAGRAARLRDSTTTLHAKEPSRARCAWLGGQAIKSYYYATAGAKSTEFIFKLWHMPYWLYS